MKPSDAQCRSIALWTCAAGFCVWAYLLALKYYYFGYWSWDLPIYAQIMWSLCHGSLNVSLFGGNFFVDHFNAIAFVLVPFYYFFQSALTLLYFKLAAFFIGGYLFYLLSAKKLAGPWALALMLGYLFYPPNVSMLLFEFNFENLALPVIFLLFYFFEEKKFLPFIVACFFLCLIKENMPLVVLMFGIYGFCFRQEDRRRWGLWPLLMGIGLFVIEVFIIIPEVRKGMVTTFAYWGLYAKLGRTPVQMAVTLFLKPLIFAKALVNSRNLFFLLELFGPFLVPALLSPHIVLLASPLFLQDLLSKFIGQQSIYYFYSATLTVFIVMASVRSLGRLSSSAQGRILGFLIVVVFIFDAWYLPKWGKEIPFLPPKDAGVRHYLLSQIPPDAGVWTSYNFLYLVSQRKDLYVAFRDNNHFSHRKEKLPKSVRYALLDFSKRVDCRNDLPKLLSQGWRVALPVENTVLLKKDGQPGYPLIEIDRNPHPSSDHPLIMIHRTLELEKLKVPETMGSGQRILPVEFDWRSAGKSPSCRIYIGLVGGGKNYYRTIRKSCYGLYLGSGDYARDVFYCLIPKLKLGQYRLVVLFAESKNKKWLRRRLVKVFQIH